LDKKEFAIAKPLNKYEKHSRQQLKFYNRQLKTNNEMLKDAIEVNNTRKQKE